MVELCDDKTQEIYFSSSTFERKLEAWVPIEEVYGEQSLLESRKVTFFVWSAAWGKILTVENCNGTEIIVVDRCCICKAHVETVGHFLFTIWWLEDFEN